MKNTRQVFLRLLRSTGVDSVIGRRLVSTACRMNGASLKVDESRSVVIKNGRSVVLPRSQMILTPAVAEDFSNIWAAVTPLEGDPSLGLLRSG